MVGIVKRPSCLVLAGFGVVMSCLALADAAVKPLGDAELASVTGAQTACMPCCYLNGRACFSTPIPPITDANCVHDGISCTNPQAVCKWETPVVNMEDICPSKHYLQASWCTPGPANTTEKCFSVKLFYCNPSAESPCVCSNGTTTALGSTTTCASGAWMCPR